MTLEHYEIGQDVDVPTSEVFKNRQIPIDAYIKTVADLIEPREKISDFPIHRLIPTQNTVNLMRVSEVDDDHKPIKVYMSKYGPQIINGHHRCTKHIMNGDETIPAKVYYPSDK